ncbi:hypothetical protein [Tengunoibacter tsumagoiensis]|uniref:Uncharacterized protein n=1 Tax=Tengunoibacter tsumagoiensis TaxID=2014871 RepID=A0A402A0R9_9CHLR|nr:hypothetical protein [Tengunoibacter tsumagoiensis]GCE12675.1 hypothetical protein KTT_25340 [Tengunoibacter tsumagoiensis]
MAFTQDELQSLNAIFDQKLLHHRRELERTFDQRLLVFKSEFEQRLTAVQQDLRTHLARRSVEQQQKTKELFQQSTESQFARFSQLLTQELAQQEKQSSPHLEDVVERSLAAQLLAFEQLINQRQSPPMGEGGSLYVNDQTSDFDAIEVQTEIPWEDLVELIDKVLEERLSSLHAALQNRVRELERVLVGHLQTLRSLMMEQSPQAVTPFQNMQEVYESIHQLEELIESMQVAMTANSALLSNRLYHHQHLPLDRAHAQQRIVPPEPAPLPFQLRKEEQSRN